MFILKTIGVTRSTRNWNVHSFWAACGRRHGGPRVPGLVLLLQQYLSVFPRGAHPKPAGLPSRPPGACSGVVSVARLPMASTGAAGTKACGLCVSGTDGGVEGTATGRKGGVDRLVSMTRGKAGPRLRAG